MSDLAAGQNLGTADPGSRSPLACGRARLTSCRAQELEQLLEEGPPVQRQRVNRWLVRYDVATRFEKTPNNR